jgi:hypothetical protein
MPERPAYRLSTRTRTYSLADDSSAGIVYPPRTDLCQETRNDCLSGGVMPCVATIIRNRNRPVEYVVGLRLRKIGSLDSHIGPHRLVKFSLTT